MLDNTSVRASTQTPLATIHRYIHTHTYNAVTHTHTLTCPHAYTHGRYQMKCFVLLSARAHSHRIGMLYVVCCVGLQSHGIMYIIDGRQKYLVSRYNLVSTNNKDCMPCTDGGKKIYIPGAFFLTRAVLFLIWNNRNYDYKFWRPESKILSVIWTPKVSIIAKNNLK